MDNGPLMIIKVVTPNTSIQPTFSVYTSPLSFYIKTEHISAVFDAACQILEDQNSGLLLPRCRDTWKPFRWFRCSKRWSWLKAALFNFAMWGCGADLQSSVIWSYPLSTIPHSSTPSPARHGTRLFTASHYSLFSIFFHVYLVWCQVQNHGNESRDCLLFSNI